VNSSASTKATASATVTVVPISVSCDIVLVSSFDMDANPSTDNHLLLPNGTISDIVGGLHLTVHNTGSAAVNAAVTLTITGAGEANCVDSAGNSIDLTKIPLEVGQSVEVICDLTGIACPTPVTISASVVGTAVVSADYPCIFNAQGQVITTAASPCSGSISCTTPVSCRVTGGGTLINGFTDQSCIPVVTELFPLTSIPGGGGIPLSKVTHGGQLGAPFSQMDCPPGPLGNPCIRGQWQHTRHYVGRGNPREIFDMDFHSNTPKGVFDTLDCACLGCCDPETGAFIPPVTGPLIHKFALCNPDDHKVCGPQPRPAPANAIIFTGVGKLSPASDAGVDNRNTTYVIFRVYIEDRSEPGGGHPGGAVEPADIYCLQVWKTGILVSRKPDFSGVEVAFRKALQADSCAFLDALSSGALPIGSLPSNTVDGDTADVHDCGPLHDGNQQIHPSTGATCNQ
jgi:hypothetical protein